MSAIGVLFVWSLATATEARGKFKTIETAAPDAFERSAALARSYGSNIYTTRTPLEAFEDTCIIHCVEKFY